MSLRFTNSLSGKISGLSFMIIAFFNIAFSGYSFASIQNNHSNDSISPQINQEMLQMFENFKERGAITESFYYQLIQSTDSVEALKWGKLLEKYQGAVSEGNDPLAEEDIIDLLDKNSDIIQSDNIINSESGEESINSEIPVDIQESGTEKIVIEEALTTDDNITVSNNERILTVNQTMVRYHIQIAASTDPLSNRYLERLYNGNLEIHHFTEDNWNKYYIGEYYTFNDAREQLDDINVEGAFVIAYAIKQKLLPYKARIIEKVFANSHLQTFHEEEKDVFRIQLAASLKPLSETELKSLYEATSKLGIIYEDDWYKYSIDGAETLSESWAMVKDLNIDGAFVVRYKKGEKLPLRD